MSTPQIISLSVRGLVIFLVMAIVLPLQVGAEFSLDDVRLDIEKGNFEQAMYRLDEILTTHPDSGEAHLLLGKIYEKKAELFLDMAIKEYEKATEDERIQYLAGKELARVLLKKGEYENAITLLSNLKEKKVDFEVVKLLGLAYLESGHLTQALENLEKARTLNPNDIEVIFSLAKVYEEKKLFDEALDFYKKVMQLSEAEGLSKIARKRIESIQQERKGLTVAEIEDPEIREMILTSPGVEDYPEAGAIILLNEYEYRVKEDNTMVETIHRLIKILNVRGRERYGEINIDYDSTYQRVEIDYARTIKPDGSIVKVGKKDIKDIDKWADFPLYSNAKVKVISMPEVLDGSVIEYKAKIFTSKLINEDDFDFRFGIQYFEPCLRHRLKLIIPKDRKINIHYVRVENEKPEIKELGNSLVYEWKINNVSEIISEPNMPPWADVSPFIMVSSFESWDEFSSWWQGLSEDKPEPTPEIIQKVEELIQGKTTQEEKAKAIYHWVISNIRYVGLEFGIAGFRPHSAEEVFNNKYGDCKDKATLLIAMYKVANIPAYYALVGTREMGRLEEDIPMSQFNHAIVLAEVNNRLIFLDPTAETAAFGEIPGAIQEKLSLVFFPEKAKFLRVPLKTPEENALRTNMVIDINPDASINVQMRILTSGATDMELRSLRYVKPARRKQIVENWINSIAPGAKLIDYKFSDLEDLNTPVELEVSFSAPDYLKKAGDTWLFTIPGIQIDAGIVGKEKRKYPLVFYTTSLSIDKAEIHLPPEFEVQYLPEDVNLKLPFVYFDSSYRAVNGNVFYQGTFARRTTQILVSQYPEYKLFIERVSRESQKQILLQKKS